MTLPARIAMKSRGTVVGHAPAREVGKLAARHRALSLFIRGQRDVRFCEIELQPLSSRPTRSRSKELPPDSAGETAVTLLNENAH